MSNPFEEPDASYSVLRNEEEHLSLWPTIAPVPYSISTKLAM